MYRCTVCGATLLLRNVVVQLFIFVMYRCTVCGATLLLRNVVVQMFIFVMYRCTVCGATLFGLRNVVVHYEGKKHKARLEEEEVPKKNLY